MGYRFLKCLKSLYLVLSYFSLPSLSLFWQFLGLLGIPQCRLGLFLVVSTAVSFGSLTTQLPLIHFPSTFQNCGSLVSFSIPSDLMVCVLKTEQKNKKNFSLSLLQQSLGRQHSQMCVSICYLNLEVQRLAFHSKMCCHLSSAVFSSLRGYSFYISLLSSEQRVRRESTKILDQTHFSRSPKTPLRSTLCPTILKSQDQN